MKIKKNENPEMNDEVELKNLVVHSMKELGEIAECFVKGDNNEHWRNELGDLCGLCIKPMLKLAGMEFDYACELGLYRKMQKMQGIKKEE